MSKRVNLRRCSYRHFIPEDQVRCRYRHALEPEAGELVEVAVAKEGASPKILFLDIEATNLDLDFGYTISVAGAVNDGKVFVKSNDDWPDAFKKDPTDDTNLMRYIWEEMANADMWVTWYGKEFDWKALQTRMLIQGLDVLPPTPHIDLFYTARSNFKLHSLRMGSVSQAFGCPFDKTPIIPRTWIRAMAGFTDAIQYVRDHNVIDVEILRWLYYEKMRPFVRTHPNLFRSPGCPNCASLHVRHRGYYMTRKGVARRRIQCGSCGHWFLLNEKGSVVREKV